MNKFVMFIIFCLVVLFSFLVFIGVYADEQKTNYEYTIDTRQVCDSDSCTLDIFSYPIAYFNGSSYEPINTTIENKSITISGRDYIFGVDKGIYEAYWRDQSSDVKDRPVAVVNNNYVLTFSPNDFITFEPHKGTTQGRVGNRVQSFAEVDANGVTYPTQYEVIGASGHFADLNYFYFQSFMKEELVIEEKQYLVDRFNSQCKEEEKDIVNLVFKNTIRAYRTDDEDSKTLGIFYGSDRSKFKEFGLSANGEFTTTDEIYFTDENNITVLYIPRLYARDSDGSPDNDILLNKTISMTAFGNLRVDILTPFTWLNDTETVFPIYIDPSISLNYTNNAILDDSYTMSTSPYNNFGTQDHLEMAVVSGTRYGYIKINTSIIPSGENILNAELKGFVTYIEEIGQPIQFKVSELHNWTWSEESITYDNQPFGAVGDEINSSLGKQSMWNSHNTTEWVNYCYENNNSCSFFIEVVKTGDAEIGYYASKENTNTTITPVLTVEYSFVSPEFSDNRTSPQFPRANDNLSISINVTDSDPIYIVNFTLFYPNGTEVFIANGTQNNNLWNSPVNHIIKTNGTYTIDVNATEMNGRNASTSWKFNITFGTLTVQTPYGTQNWTASVISGNDEVFNLTVYHTGNSPNNITFSFSNNFTNTSTINVTIKPSAMIEIQNGSIKNDIQINISANETMNSSTQIGYIYINRTNDDGVDVFESIELNISIALNSSRISIITSSFSVAKTQSESVERNFEINNTGNYNATQCQAHLTSILNPTVSFNQTNFTISMDKGISLKATISGGSVGSDAGALFYLNCIANEGGGTDTDSITGSISITETTESPPGGGGVSERIVCGDGICQYPETNETCPKDCAGVRFELSATQYTYPARAGSSIECPLLFANPCLENYTAGCPITIINPTDSLLKININIRQMTDQSYSWAKLYDDDGKLSDSMSVILEPESERDIIVKVVIPEETLDGIYKFRISFTEVSGDIFFDYNINVNEFQGTFYGLLTRYMLGNVCIGEFPFPLWVAWLFAFIVLIIIVAGVTRL